MTSSWRVISSGENCIFATDLCYTETILKIVMQYWLLIQENRTQSCCFLVTSISLTLSMIVTSIALICQPRIMALWRLNWYSKLYTQLFSAFHYCISKYCKSVHPLNRRWTHFKRNLPTLNEARENIAWDTWTC